MKNYSPIFNLLFTSKGTEQVVARRIEEHLEDNVLRENHQLGHRRSHLTQTPLSKVQSDIVETSRLIHGCIHYV